MSANYLQNTNADWIGKKKSIEEILTGKIIRKCRLRTMVSQIIGVLSGTHKRHKQSGNKKVTLIFWEKKQQRRILNFSLQDLNEQFATVNKVLPLSYASFCRKRPWWVLAPRAIDRDTCSCKIYENTRFLADELKRKQLLVSDNLKDLISQAVCSTTDKKLMYCNCRKYKDVCIIKVNKDIGQNADSK